MAMRHLIKEKASYKPVKTPGKNIPKSIIDLPSHLYYTTRNANQTTTIVNDDLPLWRCL